MAECGDCGREIGAYFGCFCKQGPPTMEETYDIEEEGRSKHNAELGDEQSEIKNE
jgi:hypothetical protein